MCLMLYLGADKPVTLRSTPDLAVVNVWEANRAVESYVARKHVYYVTAHSGCSCGFPHVVASAPLDFYDGLFEDSKERSRDVASVSELFAVVDEVLAREATCTLYPIWNGTEADPPHGDIVWQWSDMEPERLVFTEQYRYTVRR